MQEQANVLGISNWPEKDSQGRQEAISQGQTGVDGAQGKLGAGGELGSDRSIAEILKTGDEGVVPDGVEREAAERDKQKLGHDGQRIGKTVRSGEGRITSYEEGAASKLFKNEFRASSTVLRGKGELRGRTTRVTSVACRIRGIDA